MLSFEERYKNIVSLDMVNDYGTKCMLGKDDLPLDDDSVDLILCNYLMMFLSKRERSKLIREIKRIARENALIMTELYAAKDYFAITR